MTPPDANPTRRLVLVGFLLMMAVAEGWTAQPYQPTHPDPVLEPWRWRSFPELNGLGLRCMAEATDKAIWFGVDDGVRRYDGMRWTAHTPKDGLYGAPVNTLCATRDGSLYAGTDVGISRFHDGRWRRVFPEEGDPSILRQAQGSGQALPWPIHSLMEARDGSVWAGTGWGALRLSPEGVTLYTTEEMGAALGPMSPDLRLFIVPDVATPARPWGTGIGVMATGGIGLYGRGSGPMAIWAVAPGGPGEEAGLKRGDRILRVNDGPPRWSTVLGSGKGRVRLSVRRQGRADPFEVTVTRRQVNGVCREFPVFDVGEDREGAIWLGLLQGEIVRYSPLAQDSQWRLYTEKDGLDIGNAPHITQTRDGEVWTVSEHSDHGVNRFDGRRWTHFRLSDFGGDNTNPSILETGDGALWVGGNFSLSLFRNGAWRAYHPQELSIPWHRIRLLEASDGALWVAGMGQEAVRLDYGTARWTTYEGLNRQCETPDGARWFLSQDNGAVRYDGRTWTRYGPEDGLMDAPVALLATREGVLWAAGSHDSAAATARFDGKRWSLQTHPRLSWGIDSRAVYESSDGSLYFGAAVEPIPQRGQLGGVLRFDPSAGPWQTERAWTHHLPPEAPSYAYGIGQAADGLLYFGGTFGLVQFDPSKGSGPGKQAWMSMAEPADLTKTYVDAVYAAPKGDLWVGTRFYGVFRWDGKAWDHYDVRDGLADNRIRNILRTADGSVRAVTDRGISQFDGRTWVTNCLPPSLRIVTEWNELRQSPSGALWINSVSGAWSTRSRPGGPARKGASYGLRVIRYQPDTAPPETEITLSLSRVSQPGNTVLAWKGADPWRETPDEDLQYSCRMDGGEWSAFSPKRDHVFQSLNSGDHTFEVRARDRDFNADPTPAVVRFTVIPPVWKEPWFIGMVAAFVGIAAIQAFRVAASNRKLREANAALSSANRELFSVNLALTQDRALERVRAEVSAMRSVEDMRRVVEKMLEELTSLGVAFDQCVINIVDEQAGVRRQHGATGQAWLGQREEPLSGVSEAFLSIWRGGRSVVRRMTDENGMTPDQPGTEEEARRVASVLDAPFVHGTLSLRTWRPGGFGEEEVGLVEGFAWVISLGYARFLDFQRAEAQDRELERTRVLAQTAGAAAHEIFQPLSAVMGYAQMMLMDAASDDPRRRDLDAIFRAGTKIKEIVERMKTIQGYMTRPYVQGIDIIDLDKASAGTPPLPEDSEGKS